MPKAWAMWKLKTLFKNKGSKKDPKMYRGLSISSSLCKLAVCVILRRQTDWYELQLSEPQQGFRRNRGTQDAIFTVKALHQISFKMKIQVYAAFIDLFMLLTSLLLSIQFNGHGCSKYFGNA
jgi:hypothetical protein